MKNNIIDFEQYKPTILTPIYDDKLPFATYIDAEGQKYMTFSSNRPNDFIPMFEDCKQLVEYQKKYGELRRRFTVENHKRQASISLEGE